MVAIILIAMAPINSTYAGGFKVPKIKGGLPALGRVIGKTGTDARVAIGKVGTQARVDIGNGGTATGKFIGRNKEAIIIAVAVAAAVYTACATGCDILIGAAGGSYVTVGSIGAGS
jgi:hypothetical protein